MVHSYLLVWGFVFVLFLWGFWFVLVLLLLLFVLLCCKKQLKFPVPSRTVGIGLKQPQARADGAADGTALVCTIWGGHLEAGM